MALSYDYLGRDIPVPADIRDLARGELGYEELAAWFEARWEPSAEAEPHPGTESTDNP